MSSDGTTEGIAAGPPHPHARVIGVVYLLFFVTAFLATFLAKGLVLSGDAAATARSILAHEALYRSSLAVGLAGNMFYLAVTALFYRLFEPVSRSIALVATFFSLVGCAVQIFGGVFQLAPLVVLGDGPSRSAFSVEQLQAAALLCLKLHARTFDISLVLFAVYDLLLGYLVFVSRFLPRMLGVLLMLAGVGWLTFLWPPLAGAVSFFVMPFGALAEILLMLWLLFKGVDVQRWKEQASRG